MALLEQIHDKTRHQHRLRLLGCARKSPLSRLFGTSNASRLEENLESSAIVLSSEDLRTINTTLDKITIAGDRYSGEAARRGGE